MNYTPANIFEFNQEADNIQKVLDVLKNKNVKIKFDIGNKNYATLSRKQDSLLIESLMCFLEDDINWRRKDVQDYILSRLHKA